MDAHELFGYLQTLTSYWYFSVKPDDMAAAHVVKMHYIKQNRLVGLSIIIRINEMFLFDNHCVRLISELKWDEKKIWRCFYTQNHMWCLFLYNVFITKSLLKCM